MTGKRRQSCLHGTSSARSTTWWQQVGASYLDRFQYGDDRNGNRVNTDFDKLYHANGATAGYDGLNQLTEFRRGVLNEAKDSVLSPFHRQTWTLDAMGNWTTFVSVNGGTTVTQNRTHNKQNQLTQVNSTNLVFDNNGNTTTDDNGAAYVYDAWNRVVSVNGTAATYAWDALGRRIKETRSGTTTDLYYSDHWQVLEEHVAGAAKVQYVWSPVYVDALVLRDRDADPKVAGLEERLYIQQDANWNVAAVVSTAGVVLERYVYDPYGKFTDRDGGTIAVLDANWNTRGERPAETLEE